MKRVCIILVIALVLLTGCAAKENEALVQETELAENEINNSPTYTITKSELVGIWRNNLADTHRGFFISHLVVMCIIKLVSPNQTKMTLQVNIF